MSLRRFTLLFLLLVLALAFSPLPQSAPPLPSISLDAGGQTAEEDYDSYCWPASQDNTACDFASASEPENILSIPLDQTLTIIISDSPSAPNVIEVYLTNAEGETFFDLPPSEQVLFDGPFTLGENRLQIDVYFDDVAADFGISAAYVSYVFGLDVYDPADAPEPPAPLPTDEPEPAPTDEPTALPTDEPAPEPTDEPEPIIIEPTPTPDLPTPEPFTATPDLPTPTLIPTEIPPTEVPSSTPEPIIIEATSTTVSLVEPELEGDPETDEPEPDVIEATSTTVPLQSAPVEVVTATPTAAAIPATEDASRPTMTTVPLQSAPDTQPEPETGGPLPPAPTQIPFVPIVDPGDPPAVELAFAGRTYSPSGINYCQITPAGQRICVDSPLPTDGASVSLLNGYAAQIQLIDAPRPSELKFAFLNANTLQPVREFEREGDTLTLFNVDVPNGTYFLRVDIRWDTISGSYFFRVRVSG